MNLEGQLEELNKDVDFDDDVIEGAEPARFIKEPVSEDVDDISDDPTDATPDQSTAQERKIIFDLLKERGIQDPQKILYEEEDGTTTEKDFFSLPQEDQINILKDASESRFTEEELFYIQQAREKNLSLTDLIKFYANKTLEDYNNSQYKSFVEDQTDEELYIVDMKNRLGDDVTDEEILSQLQKEMELPELFKKKVDKIREEYTLLEKEELLSTQNSLKQAQEDQFQEFGESLTSLVNDVEDIGGVVLEDTDKNEILNFMLERDANGVTSFQKQMTDPENIFLAAWSILKLQDTFELLKEHYESQARSAKKPASPDPGTRPSKVVKSDKSQQQNYTSVEDLHKFE